jgi:aminoglycoside phosphotransferase (APT) family kinase protein
VAVTPAGGGGHAEEPSAFPPDATARLEAWLAAATGAARARVLHSERLPGGAIQENIGLYLDFEGGPRAGRHDLVLRTDAPTGVAVSWDRAQEFRILEAAWRAGVAAPEPWALCEDRAVLGKTFYLMRRMPGEARGFRLVRDPVVQARGDRIVAQLGRNLARLHRVTPPVVPGLGFVPFPEGPPALARVAEYRRHLDVLDVAEPVLEWALRWLEVNVPPAGGVCLIHADYRTGNYLVHEGTLSAVLDWEFAAFGDPCEDLGWMLMRYWRFGAEEREAGGVGSRAAFLDAYAAEAGRPVDPGVVRYWEVMGNVRWAVIALMQAARCFRDGEGSLELALTAHVVPVLEFDLLGLVGAIEAGRP